MSVAALLAHLFIAAYVTRPGVDALLTRQLQLGAFRTFPTSLPALSKVFVGVVGFATGRSLIIRALEVVFSAVVCMAVYRITE